MSYNQYISFYSVSAISESEFEESLQNFLTKLSIRTVFCKGGFIFGKIIYMNTHLTEVISFITWRTVWNAHKMLCKWLWLDVYYLGGGYAGLSAYVWIFSNIIYCIKWVNSFFLRCWRCSKIRLWQWLYSFVNLPKAIALHP